MDILNFGTPEPTTNPFNSASIVNGIDSVLWAERWREPSMFEFRSKNVTAMLDQLPINTVVSHTNTGDMMMVDTHKIVVDNEGIPEIIVSGKSLVNLLKYRVVGNYHTGFDKQKTRIETYWEGEWLAMPANDMALALIYESTIFADDALYGLDNVVWVNGYYPELDHVGRTISAGELLAEVYKLLDYDGFGIVTRRPYTYLQYVDGGAVETVNIEITPGRNRVKEVSFIYNSSIDNEAEYLWSNVDEYNSAHIESRWFQQKIVRPAAKQYYLRQLYVDASDVDDDQETKPTGAAKDLILEALRMRGEEAIRQASNPAVGQIAMGTWGSRSRYRRDYALGDVVSAIGDYHQAAYKRVVEYVEILDEEGFKAYPTLADFTAGSWMPPERWEDLPDLYPD